MYVAGAVWYLGDMVPYVETKTYVDAVSALERQLAELTAEHAELGGIKLHGGTEARKRTDQEQKRFTSLAGQIKTRRSKLQKVRDLIVPPWDLFHFLMDAEETLWTPEEQLMWSKEMASNEGRGELPLRIRNGLPTETTSSSCDLVKHDNGVLVMYEEVKNLQGRRKDGRFQLQDIQTGKNGRQAYGMWSLHLAEGGCFTDLDSELRIAIGTGEVTAGKLYRMLPERVRTDLLRTLLPSNVLGAYDAINCTTRNGYVRVPRDDFDRAWHLDCVTKSGPKYDLRKEYIVARLLATLSDDAPDSKLDVAA